MYTQLYDFKMGEMRLCVFARQDIWFHLLFPPSTIILVKQFNFFSLAVITPHTSITQFLSIYLSIYVTFSFFQTLSLSLSLSLSLTFKHIDAHTGTTPFHDHPPPIWFQSFFLNFFYIFFPVSSFLRIFLFIIFVYLFLFFLSSVFSKIL